MDSHKENRTNRRQFRLHRCKRLQRPTRAWRSALFDILAASQSGMASSMRLAARIRAARRRAGLSQKELADRLGVSRGAVANWESASGVLPATERLQHIAHVTGTAFEWLATGRGAAQYQKSLDDIPAADVEIVEDPVELRLLRAFRMSPQRLHAQIIEFITSRSVRVALMAVFMQAGLQHIAPHHAVAASRPGSGRLLQGTGQMRPPWM
jgi:transcriptional regulator with XRE-family HTH domain